GFLDAVVALYRRKEHSLGVDSVASGAHERNQRRVKARWVHLIDVPPPVAAWPAAAPLDGPPGGF
ncbi:MAG: hypothetical protein ACTHMR_18170, partial [Thermomicrobiales bacterium]